MSKPPESVREIRPARPDEMSQFGTIAGYVYAGAFGDGPDNVVTRNNLPEWTLCGFVDGRMATSYAWIPFTMRANGRAVALAGVTAVGTLPEYRRLGMLRAITTRSFEDMRARGQAVAALWASQAAIYQRYGYALASSQVTYRVDSVDIGFADGDRGSANVRRVPTDAAYDVIKQIYVEFVKDRATKQPGREECARAVENARELGLLLGKGGLWGQTIRLAPPMCITREDADFILAVLDEAIGAI